MESSREPLVIRKLHFDGLDFQGTRKVNMFYQDFPVLGDE